ncbi:P-loop containing nucleoside triphosphate hydrolase protein [Infundibulicybe gibba]|nr:P-loop containing nucleoside triphosphate hydrolase protein [Infundibulicybe gibba]
MEPKAIELANVLIKKLEKTEPPTRILVGIAGIPASGKTSFAHLLTKHINDRLISQSDPQSGASAILVGLDGWHISRQLLDLFPDPKLAYDRRGIHWTFDGSSYVQFIRSLRALPAIVITVPSFDHALKDPSPNAVTINPSHRIVIIEGLYTLLSIEPWREASLLLDERWLIQVDIEEAQRRIVKRHVVTGVAKDHFLLKVRFPSRLKRTYEDGKFILANMLEPTRIIDSQDDSDLALT